MGWEEREQEEDDNRKEGGKGNDNGLNRKKEQTNKQTNKQICFYACKEPAMLYYDVTVMTQIVFSHHNDNCCLCVDLYWYRVSCNSL